MATSMCKKSIMLACAFTYILVFVHLLLVGCRQAPVSQADAVVIVEPTDPGLEAAVHNALYGWLEGVPCAPPCWHNIVPGTTDRAEVIQIISSSPAISITASGHRDINWMTADKESEGRGRIRLNTDNPQVVTLIAVDQNRQITYGQVVEAFGEPSHILATAFPCVDTACNVFRLQLIYLQHGFAPQFNQGDQKPELDLQWSDFDVVFFLPPLDGFSNNGNLGHAADLQVWQGLKSFDEYCVGPVC